MADEITAVKGSVPFFIARHINISDVYITSLSAKILREVTFH